MFVLHFITRPAWDRFHDSGMQNWAMCHVILIAKKVDKVIKCGKIWESVPNVETIWTKSVRVIKRVGVQSPS